MYLCDNLMFIGQEILFISFFSILLAGVVLTFKTRWIQIRALPSMLQLLIGKKKENSHHEHTIPSTKALFTAMSTTIGMGNIVGPTIAIGFGGPGALFGFVLATLFGAASTYTEAAFAVAYRKRFKDGSISGGAMHYIKEVLPEYIATLYAFSCTVLLVLWTSGQTNQIGILLEPFGLPRSIVGIILACIIILVLVSGIKSIGNIVQVLVPFMFVLYGGAMIWIISCNASKLLDVFWLIMSSAFSFKATGGATIGYGFTRAMRWGLAKGFQSNESSLGTAGIAHAAAQADKPTEQATLAMISVYANGLLCLLSGTAILVTGIWHEATLPFDITMINCLASRYFAQIGTVILTVSSLLFVFTTVLGNSYFGTRCYLYVTNNRLLYWYYALIALSIYIGTVSDVKIVWAIGDYFMVPVAIFHIIALLALAYKKGDILND